MNIFEDLIEELKEENLLEETVIEASYLEKHHTYQQPTAKQTPTVTDQQFSPGTETEPAAAPTERIDVRQGNLFSTEVSNPLNPGALQFEGFEEAGQAVEEPNAFLGGSIDEPFEPLAFTRPNVPSLESNETASLDSPPVSNLTHLNDPVTAAIIEEEESLLAAAVPISDDSGPATDFHIETGSENPLLTKTIPAESEFYRRRATEEVNSLQIVEHIISAIEREHLKIVSRPYDDLSVSMALHDFLKLTETPNTLEHAQAEFKLMQETQSWYSALAQRDDQIPVENLRKYCENARPSLSAQALISLARFYRNSPFSEKVRSKFEMVVTRLLTKEVSGDLREMILTREELIKQLENLYADWSSIPLYESIDDDSDVLIGVLKFEDFAAEAVAASKFEELIKNDFFNRLKIYKESTGEKFFAPLLAATAIESNVIIGNRYVALLNQERERDNSRLLEEKYSFLLDQSVSEATSKTLQLVELLKERKDETDKKGPTIQDVVVREHDKRSLEFTQPTKKRRFSIVTIAVLVLALLSLGGMYYWAEYLSPEMRTSPSVKKVNLDNSSLKAYFKTARISKNTFFAVAEPAWDRLSRDVKEDLLKKTLAVGSQKGYDKIHVLDDAGKTIAFASDLGITIEP
jgi:hypothetical protein